jgi:hypothetical protein
VVLNANNLGGVKPAAPLYQYHGHVLTQVLAQTDVVNWLSARVAGTAARGSC